MLFRQNSVGAHRLAITLGVVAFVTLFIYAFITQDLADYWADIGIFVIVCAALGLLVWAFIHAIFWIVAGFRSER